MVTNIQQNSYVSPTSIDTAAETRTESAAPNNIESQIQNYLKDLPPQQVVSLTELVKSQQQLNTFFATFPEQTQKFNRHIKRINKCLDYKKKFKVAIVAVTGTGKSTLLNSMLARDLVFVKNVGGAGTGCALYLHQDVPDNAPETAIVTYRDEQNIRQLIKKYFIDRYSLNPAILEQTLDEGFILSLAQTQADSSLSQDEQSEFTEIKSTLVGLVKQYVRHNPAHLKQTYNLNDAQDKRQLLDLIDEGDATKQTKERTIGLVKVVDYHVKATRGNTGDATSSALSLPNNVCLVDLPGLDGTSLHNIIIREGIEDADAVLFVVHPRRFQTLSNTDLLSRINRFVSSDHDPQSSDRIFLVINGKDEITESFDRALPKIEQNAHQFLEKIAPGSSQHAQQFVVSAWAALQAQKAMKGESIDAPNQYAGVQKSLNVADGDHAATLTESHIPKLIEALNTFAKNYMGRQIQTARHELAFVFEALTRGLEQEKALITQGEGDRYHRTQINQLIKDRQDDARSLVETFRQVQISQLFELRNRLTEVAIIMCDEADHSLQAEMPRYWKKHFDDATHRPSAEPYGGVKEVPFLGDVEVSLWDALSIKVQGLAHEVVRCYELGLTEFGLSQRVTQCGHGQITLEAIEQELHIGIRGMSEHLRQAVRGFVIGPLVDPAHQFINFANDDAEKSSELLAIIKQTMPLAKDLVAGDFYNLAQAIRAHYQVAVLEDCLTSLLNLYHYEMIRVETRVLNFIEEQFEQLRNDKTVTLESLSDEDANKPEWVKLAHINNQLGMIQTMTM